jgi:hypothetical protein
MVNSYYDGSRQVAMLVYQHDSFEIVPEGASLPTLQPEFVSLRCDSDEQDD